MVAASANSSDVTHCAAHVHAELCQSPPPCWTAGVCMTLDRSATWCQPHSVTHLHVTSLLCFSQKLDLGASASVAKSLFHWLRGRFMMLKRMLRIQFL